MCWGPNCYESTEPDDKWSNVFVASGFEIYGILKEKSKIDKDTVQHINSIVEQLKECIQPEDKSTNVSIQVTLVSI